MDQYQGVQPLHLRQSWESGFKARIHAPSEWEKQRHKIAELYLDHSLEEVRKIMAEEHNFYAKGTQYKKKIGKWNLNKSLNKTTVLALLDIKRRRELSGKSTVFIHKGRTVRADNLERSRKRFKDINQNPHFHSTDGVKELTLPVATPPGVEYCTPSPSSVKTGSTEEALSQYDGDLMMEDVQELDTTVDVVCPSTGNARNTGDSASQSSESPGTPGDTVSQNSMGDPLRCFRILPTTHSMGHGFALFDPPAESLTFDDNLVYVELKLTLVFSLFLIYLSTILNICIMENILPQIHITLVEALDIKDTDISLSSIQIYLIASILERWFRLGFLTETLACTACWAAIFKRLETTDPSADINSAATNYMYWFEVIALFNATKVGELEGVRLLLDIGYCPLLRRFLNGTMALHEAARNGHVAIVRLLLERGIDPSLHVGSGWTTALHEAAKGGHESVVQVLLEKGSDPLQNRWDGNTALHEAVVNGHEAVVQLILEKGGDPLQIGWDGYSALHDAVKNGHQEVARLLLEKGAEVSAKTWDGLTPLDLAVKNNHKMIVKLLEDAGAEMPGV